MDVGRHFVRFVFGWVLVFGSVAFGVLPHWSCQYCFRNLTAELCGIDKRDDLTLEEFEELYYLQKPVILQGSQLNEKLDWSKDRLRKDFGNQTVNSGTSIEYAHDGKAKGRVSIQRYIDYMSEEATFNGSEYFVFDRGSFFNREVEFAAEFKRHPFFSKYSATQTFSLGKSGTGIHFHSHHDAWLEVLFVSRELFLH
jgi:hypothetical protein